MKQSLFLCFAVFLVPSTVRAQKNFGGPGIFGVVAGAQFPKLNVSGATTPVAVSTEKVGFRVGGLLGYDVHENLGVQLEAVYNQYDPSFTYFDLPFLLRPKLELKLLTLYLVAGPDMQFRIKGSGFKNFVLAVDGGGGVDVNYHASGSIFVDVRYSFGILPAGENVLSASETYKWRSLQVLAGFRFRFDPADINSLI